MSLRSPMMEMAHLLGIVCRIYLKSSLIAARFDQNNLLLTISFSARLSRIDSAPTTNVAVQRRTRCRGYSATTACVLSYFNPVSVITSSTTGSTTLGGGGGTISLQ